MQNKGKIHLSNDSWYLIIGPAGTTKCKPSY
jgi:hypothetical protein